MAIAATALVGAGSGTNATSYTTASITPTANRLVLAAVTSASGGVQETPTLSGNGLTWVQVATVENAAVTFRITLFRAMGASPSAGAVTIDFGGVTQTKCAWSIVEFSDSDTSGTDGSGAIVQFKTATGTAATAGTADFDAAFGDGTNNATYSAIAPTVGAEDVVHEAGFTELHDVSTTETQRLETMWRLGEDQTPTPTWTTAASFCQIGVEIKASGAAATVDPYPYIGGGYYPVEG